MGEKGHATGMAGEFHAMEVLYRKGHKPALTLGNAKSVDILSEDQSGKIHRISVKAIRGGGKFGIGTEDYADPKYSDLAFMLFRYNNFNDLNTVPETWIVPAVEAEAIKRPWHAQKALYLYKDLAPLLEPFRDAWHHLGVPDRPT